MKFWYPFALAIFSDLIQGIILFFHLFQYENKDCFASAGTQRSPLCQRLWKGSAISLPRFLLDLSGFQFNRSYVFANLLSFYFVANMI